ncbi:MAG: hypothetical protein HY689_11145 [Chloroflexi bacterium]|nr:hypothetical protein [Chloroflexota bacterium]
MSLFHDASHDAVPAAEHPTLTWEAPQGTLRIWSHASEALILGLTIDPGFGVLFRLNRYQDEFLRIARRADGNVLLAVADPGRIVGYILVERPVPRAWQRRIVQSRWEDCPAIYELGALEVSRNYRRLRIAERLLEVLVADPAFQDKILVTTVMRRYWDLAGTGMDAWRYRASLVNLLVRYGFQEYATDDPRVITEPTDALLARIGPATAPEYVQQFHRLRLAHTPPTL